MEYNHWSNKSIKTIPNNKTSRVIGLALHPLLTVFSPVNCFILSITPSDVFKFLPTLTLIPQGFPPLCVSREHVIWIWQVSIIWECMEHNIKASHSKILYNCKHLYHETEILFQILFTWIHTCPRLHTDGPQSFHEEKLIPISDCGSLARKWSVKQTVCFKKYQTNWYILLDSHGLPQTEIL